MAIIKCHECGKPVSTEVTACISCGAPISVEKSKARSREKIMKASGIAVFFAALIVMCSIIPEKEVPIKKSEDNNSIAIEPDRGIEAHKNLYKESLEQLTVECRLLEQMYKYGLIYRSAYGNKVSPEDVQKYLTGLVIKHIGYENIDMKLLEYWAHGISYSGSESSAEALEIELNQGMPHVRRQSECIESSKSFLDSSGYYIFGNKWMFINWDVEKNIDLNLFDK
jgi:hypothetical protein